MDEVRFDNLYHNEPTKGIFHLLKGCKITAADLPDELPYDFYASIMYEIYSLNEKETYVILHRFNILNMFKHYETQAEIAECLNIHRSRVGQIEQKAIYKLSKDYRRNIMINGINKYIDNTITLHEEERKTSNIGRGFIYDINDKEFLNTNVSNLLFPSIVYHTLRRSGINTIKDILDNEDRITSLNIRNLGKYKSNEVIKKMRSLGFTNFGTLRRT